MGLLLIMIVYFFDVFLNKFLFVLSGDVFEYVMLWSIFLILFIFLIKVVVVEIVYFFSVFLVVFMRLIVWLLCFCCSVIDVDLMIG